MARRASRKRRAAAPKAPGGSVASDSASARPEPERRPAGLFRRLGAAVYDSLLVLATLFAATAVVLPLTGGEAVPAGTIWYPAYLIGVSYVYFAGFWIYGGQTLGMRAWKLRRRRRCAS